MKAVFIIYNQSIIDHLLRLLDRLALRGYTQWEQVKGIGSRYGQPHLGTHTWPAINNAMLVVCDEEKAQLILQELKVIDTQAPEQGLRAFSWDVQTWSD